MAKKCPLCGGKLKNNYCDSCGYAVPNDEELSAAYDMDPSNDAFGEQIREITPDAQAEEIYPNRPEAPRFKVRDDEGKTVGGNYGGKSGQAGQNTPPPQYHANNAGRTPPPPYANRGNRGNRGNTGRSFDIAALKEFAKKYWWYWVMIFLMPWWIAAILTIVFISCGVFEKRFRLMAVVSLVIAIIISPW